MTMESPNEMQRILRRAAPILPVVTIDEPSQGLHIVGALRRAGMGAVEIALRTPAALPALADVRSAFPDLLIGAGTVLNAAMLDRAMDAGADFAVSPGFSRELVRLAAARDFPFLPGVMTPSEIMEAMALGCEVVKLFPAIPSGGAAWLKAMRGPFPRMRFCPTGGVDLQNIRELLSLDNVVCAGGSWFLDQAALKSGRWDDIELTSRSVLAALSAS